MTAPSGDDATRRFELRAGPGDTLAVIDDDTIRARLRDDGLVIVRGFGADEDGFAAFVRRFSARFVPDLRAERPAHPRVHGLHGVDLGSSDLLLHFEMGALPMQPDLVAFLCLQPASSGGDTVVCDGAAAWRALSPAAQRALRKLRVVFRSTIPRTIWARMAGLASIGDVEHDMATFRAQVPAAHDFDYTFERVPAALGHVALVTRTAKPVVIAQPWAPRRKILGASLTTNYTTLTVELESGGPAPPALVEAVDAACARTSVAIRWSAGDLALVDNQRCMHGRTRFDDPARRLVGLMALAADAVQMGS